MEAFLTANERRRADGRPLDRHSVASFFVSRVDTEVDKRLEALGRSDLAGRAGLANARAAYQAFKRVFEGERFRRLREAGCPVQRPLWASTGVKNPHYDETMYVYGLVAPHTVNTMPLPTLLAAAQSGEVTGATADQDPTADLDALREAGIDIDDVTAQLLRDGIEAFLVPMAKLLDGIERKREAIVTGRPAAIEADLPPELEQPVAARLKQAAEQDVARRIWQRDGTLWAPAGTPELTDRLGWLTIAGKLLEEADELDAFRRGVPRGRLHRRGAAGHGRLEPGPRGLPPVLRRAGGRAAAARARLHRAVADRGGRAGDRRAAHAVHRLDEVRRDDRDAVAVQALPRPPARRSALRRGHRPRLVARGPRRRARLPPRVPQRPGDRRALLGAVVLRDRAGGAGRDRRAPGAGGRAGRRAGVRRLPGAGGQHGAVAGRRARRAGPPRPRQADLRGRSADRLLRAVGRAARRREHRQAGPRHPAGGRRAAARSRQLRPRPRLRPPARRRGARRRPRRQGRRARAGRATRPSRCRCAAPTTSAGSSSSRSSRPPSPAGCSRSTRSTSPTSRRPRTRPPRCCTRARQRSRTASRARCSAASPRRTTWRSWATCPTPARSTPRSAGCARRSPRATTRPRRSATARASCTRPASSTRAARRPGASSSSSTTRTRTPTCPASRSASGR